jgi:hypothetical protein
MVPIVVPLRSRRQRRALAVQKFQHVLPAIPLLIAGLQALAAAARGLPLVLALFEIGTSILLLGTVVRELRAVRNRHVSHGAHHVDWFHVFAAGVLLAEAAEHWHETHHWKRPTLLMAAVTLALGLLHGWIDRYSERRRALRLDDDGIYVGGRPFGSFRAAWSEVEGVDVGERFATIRARGGRERRIDLSDCEQPAPLRAALADAATRLRALTAE